MPRLDLRARLQAGVRAALAPQPVVQPLRPAVGPAPRYVLRPLVQRWDHETEMYVPCGPWSRLELLPEEKRHE
jgi:hypothetical protein